MSCMSGSLEVLFMEIDEVKGLNSDFDCFVMWVKKNISDVVDIEYWVCGLVE